MCENIHKCYSDLPDVVNNEDITYSHIIFADNNNKECLKILFNQLFMLFIIDYIYQFCLDYIYSEFDI